MTEAEATGAVSREPEGWYDKRAYRNVRRLQARSVKATQEGLRNRVPQGALVRLERYESKGSRTVLRGGDGGNAVSLPDISNLGEALFWCGEYAEAQLSFNEGLAIADEIGVPRLHAYARAYVSSAMAHQGKYREARAYADQLLNLARAQELAWGTPWALEVLGVVALALNENDVARQWLEESLSLAREPRLEQWRLHYPLGIIALRQGRASQARLYLYEALLRVTETRDVTDLTSLLPALALFLSDQDKREQAVELYALASRCPHVANSQWYHDVIGKHIAAVAATLPPEAVSAAQERGRARDLWETAEELLEELDGQLAE